MREDMASVVRERMRYSSSRRRNVAGLSPLRRFLAAQVGRPWDKVFSEICSRFGRTSAVKGSIRDNLREYVATDVVLIDGVPHQKAGCPRGTEATLEQLSRRTPLYVCPKSGILKRVKVRDSKRTQAKKNPDTSFRINELEEVQRKDKQWFLVTRRKVSSRVDGGTWSETQYQEVSRRQLSRDELKQLPVPLDFWKR